MTAAGPLAGRRIAITRDASRSDDLVARLTALGATPVVLSTIAIAPPADPAALDAALTRLATYDWIVFTSVTAVRAVLERAHARGQRSPFPPQERVRVAAVGPATAAALRDGAARGAIVTPPRATAAALAAVLGDVAGQAVLLPRADIARPDLPAALRARGATVDEVVAYRTVPGPDAAALVAALRDGRLDAITFASASAVRYFVDAARDAGAVAALHAPGAPRVVCIGPATAAAARETGLVVAATADEHDAAGLVRAVVACLGASPEGDD